MNRKLLALNIAMAIGVIYAGIELHGAYVAARARQARMPGPKPPAPFVAPVAPLPQQPAVLPSRYKDVAVHDLFDASRDPSIPVEPPPPPPPPPVPPPLPSFHGMMDFGDPQGPVALITQHDVAGHQEVHAGEMIGEFKLVAFNRQEMTLDWRGMTIHKRLNEGGSEEPKAAAAPATAGPLPLAHGVIPGVASQNQNVEPPSQQSLRELGPGITLTDTVRACQKGDSFASGDVSGGYRKEISATPMGQTCVWRAIGK